MAEDARHAFEDHLAGHGLAATAFESGKDRVLHGGDLRCFGRNIPWSLDQTPVVGGYQRRGRRP